MTTRFMQLLIAGFLLTLTTWALQANLTVNPTPRIFEQAEIAAKGGR
jgi:hypothetical protein